MSLVNKVNITSMTKIGKNKSKIVRVDGSTFDMRPKAIPEFCIKVIRKKFSITGKLSLGLTRRVTKNLVS